MREKNKDYRKSWVFIKNLMSKYMRNKLLITRKNTNVDTINIACRQWGARRIYFWRV